ncbi:hypothetical protein [Gracilibacillus halophilus]|nr:hypothetical protein [Gracilibacillus halophilus]
MSYNAFLFAIIAGVLTFIFMSAHNPIDPILVTNILLGLIVGILIDKKQS